MHSFLRTIGFSNYTKEKDIKNLLATLRNEYTFSQKSVLLEDGQIFTEIRAEVAPDMGVCMLGMEDEEGEFYQLSYFPYLRSSDETTKVPFTINKLIDSEMYSVLGEEPRVGVSLIFRLDNVADFKKHIIADDEIKTLSANLSGLCLEGKIILPMDKTPEEIAAIEEHNKKRAELLEAAKVGDEKAMELIGAEDMSTFMITMSRLQNEDIYSIVDTTFLPQGTECDLYSVVGEITAINVRENAVTEEKVFDFTLNCNDMIFHVCANTKDVIGEPEIGRRFKGFVWMQGFVNFADEE